MGTSASSKGPKSGVSFDPPWLDDDGGLGPVKSVGGEPDGSQTPEKGKTEDNLSPPSGSSIAPPSRFSNARRNLGKFARDRNGKSGFKKAAGHYSKTGMGGSGRLASRMKYSTATGARLAGFLSSASSGTDTTVTTWVKDIVDRGISGQELIDAITRHVAPNGGSKEEASSSDSMNRALAEFYEKNPDSDLLSLDENEVREVTENFMANEACSRLTNDIGQVLEGEKISLRESLSILSEMREYLRADLSVQIKKLWIKAANPTHSQLDRLLQSSIQRTFEIYEGEI